MYTKEVFNNKMNSWINIDAENEDELKNLYRDYGIDSEFVDYSLDRMNGRIWIMTKKPMYCY